MKTRIKFLLFFSAAISLLAAFSAFGQTARPKFDRPQTYDVQHYKIDVSFDRAKKTIKGDTTISLRPLSDNFRELELDAVDILFSSIVLADNNVSLGFKAAREKVLVSLDKPYSSRDTIFLRFRYTASPKKGIYFVDAPARSDGSTRSAQIWTQGEPEEARHWFPSFDFPSDKATTEQVITVEKGLTVIGNGELLAKRDNDNGTVTWHYKMPVPHSTYLVSFVVGNYIEIKDRYKDIPLGFFVYPGKENTARNAFGGTKQMFSVFEEITGVPYPFNKYDQTIVADFQFGGMENITATTLADSEIFFADMEFGRGPVMDLVSHELAHSWFGNLVTCRNWAELWLNEGFATFMEAAFREKINSRGDYLRKVRADAAAFLIDDTINRRRHALYNQRAGDVDSLFDNAATTYQKGGAVIHTLREQVGDVNFWRGVKIYLDRHKFANVGTNDLQKAMEESSGQDLGWFFDQWVYGAGAPRLTLVPSYSARTGTLTLAFSQTQTLDTITPSKFRLPMEVTISTKGVPRSETIEMTQRTQTFKFKVDAKPTEIIVDPNEKIPLKRLTVRPIKTLR